MSERKLKTFFKNSLVFAAIMVAFSILAIGCSAADEDVDATVSAAVSATIGAGGTSEIDVDATVQAAVAAAVVPTATPDLDATVAAAVAATVGPTATPNIAATIADSVRSTVESQESNLPQGPVSEVAGGITILESLVDFSDVQGLGLGLEFFEPAEYMAFGSEESLEVNASITWFGRSGTSIGVQYLAFDNANGARQFLAGNVSSAPTASSVNPTIHDESVIGWNTDLKAAVVGVRKDAEVITVTLIEVPPDLPAREALEALARTIATRF